MSVELKITILQSRIHWQDVQANLDGFTTRLEQLSGQTDLIVLPEMFQTGFSMQSQHLAETMDGKTVRWMAVTAEKYQAAVMGSLMIREGAAVFNRLIWMLPNGQVSWYDKRHLFRMASEHEHYHAGSKRLIIAYKGWNICPLICYDLRFPVWSRNRFIDGQFDYDCLIYVANWPEKRSHAWKSLLVARAIENQCYVVGVNRIGADGNQVQYSGDSAVLDFQGERISKTERFGDRMETIVLRKDALDAYRSSFPVFMDADRFQILSS
jgi:predicted amidohydrolase